MNHGSEQPLTLREGRFSRLEAVAWWSQERLRAARVLVVGAGALGNEVIKNLCLLGIGRLVIVDMDRVEEHNLCRSVLFRAQHEGQPKAACAARAARELYPDVAARGLVGNVLADVGLGWFRHADVVVGALDNREARLFVNRACAEVARPWIDGGIDVLNGIVRGFAPPQTACYECTLGAADWELLAKRRSCALLARRAAAERGTPTTPTTAAVIGAIQAQEVVKRLHGLESLAGTGYAFEGLRHTSYAVQYPIAPECPWHEPPPPIEDAPGATSQTPLCRIADWAASRLGGLDAIDLSRELVAVLECPGCNRQTEVWRPLEHVRADEATCPRCGAECVPRLIHSVTAGQAAMERTATQLGLPPYDLIWCRHGTQAVAVALDGDPWNEGGAECAGGGA